MMPSMKGVACLFDQWQVLGVRIALDRWVAVVAVVEHTLGEQADQSDDGLVVSVQGEVRRQHVVAEDALTDGNGFLEVSPRLVELCHDDRAGETDAGALLPQGHRGGVDPIDGGHDEQGGVGGPQPGPQLADEIGVARAVEEVDSNARVVERCHGERYRTLLALLGQVGVADGGAFFTLPARGIVPLAASSASTSDVLPAPECPTRTTFRIWSALLRRPHRRRAHGPSLSLFHLPSRHLQGLPALTTPLSGIRHPCCLPDKGASTAKVQVGCPLPSNHYSAGKWTLMLNVLARARISHLVDPLGARLARTGISPDVVTLIGTTGAVSGSLVFFPQGWFFVGTLVIWFFVMFDMLDGAVARARGITSRWGAFLDSTLDRVADAAVFGGLAWWFAGESEGLLLASLLCLVLGTLTSYIKARAEGLGMTCNVGFAERSERLIIVLVGTGLEGLGMPYALAVALWLLVAASAITVVQRLMEVRRQAVARTGAA